LKILFLIYLFPTTHKRQLKSFNEISSIKKKTIVIF